MMSEACLSRMTLQPLTGLGALRFLRALTKANFDANQSIKEVIRGVAISSRADADRLALLFPQRPDHRRAIDFCRFRSNLLRRGWPLHAAGSSAPQAAYATDWPGDIPL